MKNGSRQIFSSLKSEMKLKNLCWNKKNIWTWLNLFLLGGPELSGFAIFIKNFIHFTKFVKMKRSSWMIKHIADLLDISSIEIFYFIATCLILLRSNQKLFEKGVKFSYHNFQVKIRNFLKISHYSPGSLTLFQSNEIWEPWN